MLACEPASFWREKLLAVVILLRVLAKLSWSSGGNELSNVRRFNLSVCDPYRACESKVQWSFQGCLRLRIREKTFSQISNSSSNLKVSTNNLLSGVAFIFIIFYFIFCCMNGARKSRSTGKEKQEEGPPDRGLTRSWKRTDPFESNQEPKTKWLSTWQAPFIRAMTDSN